MSTEQFIYSEEFVRGRIYSYLKFKRYLKSIAKIVCDELDFNEEIIDVNITLDRKTVWVIFKEHEFGFDTALLWDRNIRKTVQSYLDYDSDTK